MPCIIRMHKDLKQGEKEMKKLTFALLALMVSLNVVIAAETSDVDCSAIVQSGSDVSTSSSSTTVDGSGSDVDR